METPRNFLNVIGIQRHPDHHRGCSMITVTFSDGAVKEYAEYEISISSYNVYPPERAWLNPTGGKPSLYVSREISDTLKRESAWKKSIFPDSGFSEILRALTK